MRSIHAFVGTVFGIAASLCTPAFGVATPEQRCQAAKNLLAGKHAQCLHRAEQKLALRNDTARYAAMVARCEQIFSAKWGRVVAKATKQGATCPDAPLTEAEFGSTIGGHSQNIATALAGGGLTDCAADLATCEDSLWVCGSGLAACNADLASCTSSCPTALLVATGAYVCHDNSGTFVPCAGTGQDGDLRVGRPPAFVDNGDGTITDLNTGLMWEKLSDDGSIHDKDNKYTWDDALGTRMAALNAGGGFVGFTDWRVPNCIELESLADYGDHQAPLIHPVFDTGCIPGCTVTTCSCTTADEVDPPSTSAFFWSSTSSPAFPTDARGVHFGYTGFDAVQLYAGTKLATAQVRAVRGGL